MYSEKIVVGAGTEYPLNGLMTLPSDLSKPVPAVVMVHGSGASNMDEKVLKLTPFKDLAEGLAVPRKTGGQPESRIVLPAVNTKVPVAVEIRAELLPRYQIHHLLHCFYSAFTDHCPFPFVVMPHAVPAAPWPVVM